MTLREAEKAVLEAADRWEATTTDEEWEREHDLIEAVRAYRKVKSAGKPRAKCYCGRTVSIEGDHLRHHSRGDDHVCGHAPSVSHVLAKGGKLL